MRKVWIAAVCTLGLFACGRDKPAEDPSTTTTSITTETTSTPVTTRTPAATPSPTTSNPTDGRDATYAGGMENNTQPAITTTAPAAAITPAAAPATAPKGDKPVLNDRDITAAIRRAVVADKALSFGAKNVHIDVSAGNVTLKGNVKSEEEKSSIEAKAKSANGVGAVDNQLQVKK